VLFQWFEISKKFVFFMLLLKFVKKSAIWKF
jgi:hypothetical protein